MSSIRDLFGDPLLDEGSDAPFDGSNLASALDQVIRDRPPIGVPEGYEPTPPLVAQGDPPPDDDPDDPLPPEPVLPDPGLGEPAPPEDPFASLNDLERQELLAIRQALSDPERATAVKRAYLGVPDPPPAPPVPAATAPAAPAPTLPEDVDPDSFEAQLWHQNQRLEAQILDLKGATQAQTAQTEQQLAMNAAKAATLSFAQRYGDKLSPEEIQAICSHAGAERLPEAFLPTTVRDGMPQGNLEEAMGKSLEFVLRSNDTLLGKVLGAPDRPAAPPQPGDSPVAQGRKRQLTALSSAASPSGEAPVRAPLEHREDGRLTEGSRQSLIAQLMAGMNAEGEGN